MINDKRRPARNAAANSTTADTNAFVGLDELLEVRERLVMVLDAIDQDDVDGARFYTAGLLEDFDREVAS